MGDGFGDPGGPDAGAATSTAASALVVRARGAEELSPQMGRMGTEDRPMRPPGRARRPRQQGRGRFSLDQPACSIALLVSTRARCFLYSGLARRSPDGFSPSDACCAASSAFAPFASASSTALARTGVGPTLVRPMRQWPLVFWAATPTMAQSNSRRRNLMYL